MRCLVLPGKAATASCLCTPTAYWACGTPPLRRRGHRPELKSRGFALSIQSKESRDWNLDFKCPRICQILVHELHLSSK
jgi:hypothetical protein